MTQVYRISLTQSDYAPPTAVYTHTVRASIGQCTVETRHYSAEDAQRERDWQRGCGNSAEVVCKSN